MTTAIGAPIDFDGLNPSSGGGGHGHSLDRSNGFSATPTDHGTLAGIGVVIFLGAVKAGDDGANADVTTRRAAKDTKRTIFLVY